MKNVSLTGESRIRAGGKMELEFKPLACVPKLTPNRRQGYMC